MCNDNSQCYVDAISLQVVYPGLYFNYKDPNVIDIMASWHDGYTYNIYHNKITSN